MIQQQPATSYPDQEGVNKSRRTRMTFRPNSKKYMIYPENRGKGFWDLFITVILLVSCILIPIQIAFET
jgi:hypothetical protein